ncbi:hypothetical protein ACR2XN_28450, partial [Klebsiella pneumoniae]
IIKIFFKAYIFLIKLLSPMKARLKEESWMLADLFQRFYGYIFCKPLGDNTPLVEIDQPYLLQSSGSSRFKSRGGYRLRL